MSNALKETAELNAGKVVAAITERSNQPFELTEVTLDDLRHDEVRVQLRATGMCHTDLAARDGNLPFPLPAVLGHEGAGLVEEVGSSVTEVVPGDRVVLSFASCGRCLPCRTGQPVQCVHWVRLNLLGGVRLDGSETIRRTDAPNPRGHFFGQSSFATHAICPERGVIRIESDVDWPTLAPLGCSGQTGAGSVLNVLRPGAGDTLVVYGAGAVGLAAVLAAQLTPVAQIIAVDRVPSRLEMALSLGATATIDASTVDLVAEIQEITSGRGADSAIETTGNVDVLRQGIDSLAVNGRCAVVGAPPFGSEVALDVPNMLSRNPRIIGVNQGLVVPQQFIPALVALHEQGRFPIDRLVTTFPFEAINDAATAARDGSVIKPVLIFP